MSALSATLPDRPPLPAAETEDDPVLLRLVDVEPHSIAWLWPGRIPLGKLTLLVGDPGHGKSLLALDVAARVTRGLPWPDGSKSFSSSSSSSSSILPSSPAQEESSTSTTTTDDDERCSNTPGAARAPLGKVILLTAEDDLADTVRPRLDAAGADPEGVVHLQAARRADLASGRPFSLARDLPALERALAMTGGVRLVILDPLTAYFGAADSHQNTAVRGILGPLAELAARTGVAVLGISHLNKNAAASLLYRATGSVAFVAQSRAVHVVLEDIEQRGRRFFLPLKTNLAGDVPGLAFTIVASQSHAGAPIIAWEPEPVDLTAGELMGAGSGPATRFPSRHRAAQWLRETLAAGPKPCQDVTAQAKAEGISGVTLLRAKRQLGVVAILERRDRCWFWRLPETVDAPPEPRLPDPVPPPPPAPSEAAEQSEVHRAADGQAG
jgi:hypothetical protein